MNANSRSDSCVFTENNVFHFELCGKWEAGLSQSFLEYVRNIQVFEKRAYLNRTAYRDDERNGE